MEDLASTFKALSDETRLRIIKLLERGELCVCDIVAALDIVQPRASFHLGVLWEAGLIQDRKEGKWMHYSLSGSNLFKRMLLVSVCDKADGRAVAQDRKRLERFLGSKTAATGCITKKNGCCGS